MADRPIPFRARAANGDRPDPTPPQPGLRSFIVYDELPEGCIAVEVLRNTAPPHVRKGDFVVVDTTDIEPAEGDLFAIEWSNGAREVVELVLRGGHYGKRGAPTPFPYGFRWWVRMYNPVLDVASGRAIPAYFADGPYEVDYLKEKLVGRVVGILEPDFRPALARRAA